MKHESDSETYDGTNQVAKVDKHHEHESSQAKVELLQFRFDSLSFDLATCEVPPDLHPRQIVFWMVLAEPLLNL